MFWVLMMVATIVEKNKCGLTRGFEGGAPM
jgi:hypothetical protein